MAAGKPVANQKADKMADETAGTAPVRRGGRPKKARGAANSSDTDGARWTVRGVPENVRTIATKAAHDRGMTVGDWLAEAVVSYYRSAADGVSADNGAKVPAVIMPDELRGMLDDIRTRLAAIETAKPKTLLGRLLGRQD
jgi:hypothetical protein